MKIKKNVICSQAKNCTLWLQIGTTAFIFGKGKIFNKKVEILTPYYKFRIV